MWNALILRRGAMPGLLEWWWVLGGGEGEREREREREGGREGDTHLLACVCVCVNNIAAHKYLQAVLFTMLGGPALSAKVRTVRPGGKMSTIAVLIAE